MSEVWLEPRRLSQFSDVLTELDDDPSPRAVLNYLHALVREIVRLEDRGWIRERLVDLLFYERRRWCWEIPVELWSPLPPKYPTAPVVERSPLSALPTPLPLAIRRGSQRTRVLTCPGCPTVISVGLGAAMPETCSFCGYPLAQGFRALAGRRV